MARPGRVLPFASMFLVDGQLHEAARREYVAVVEGLFYLGRWRKGPVAAGAETCAHFGRHRDRGGICERCGERQIRGGR